MIFHFFLLKIVDLFSNSMEFCRFYKIVIPNFQMTLIYVTSVSGYKKILYYDYECLTFKYFTFKFAKLYVF